MHVAVGSNILVYEYTTLSVSILLWMDIVCFTFLLMVNAVGI